MINPLVSRGLSTDQSTRTRSHMHGCGTTSTQPAQEAGTLIGMACGDVTLQKRRFSTLVVLYAPVGDQRTKLEPWGDTTDGSQHCGSPTKFPEALLQVQRGKLSTNFHKDSFCLHFFDTGYRSNYIYLYLSKTYQFSQRGFTRTSWHQSRPTMTSLSSAVVPPVSSWPHV